MSVSYEAKVRESRWIAGERVVVDLRIENRGTATFETPDPSYRTSAQPHFELSAPGGGKQEFRPDSRATDWDRGQPPTLLRVAPGGRWEGDLALSAYANLEAPGRYILRSWIEHDGSRIESRPSEFEIVRAQTRDLSAETSFGEGNSIVVECVELLDGGQVASSILNERDPANAELIPFQRLQRGATEPRAQAILAPYANVAVGLSALRWIVARSNHTVVVGHNLNPARRAAFGGAELSRVLEPVATAAGLYLAGLRGSELLLNRATGSESGVETGPVWTVEKLPAAPGAAALTVSPAAAGNILFFVLAWSGDHGTEVRFMTAGPDGQVIARASQTLRDLRPLGPAAAGWSTSGEIRASFLVRAAARETELRVAEFALHADLATAGAPRLSEPPPSAARLSDARLAYFESVPGQLSRMALIRAADGKAWVISAGGTPRAPQTAIPSSGPLAVLPGQVHWYAVWPKAGLLDIGPL